MLSEKVTRSTFSALSQLEIQTECHDVFDAVLEHVVPTENRSTPLRPFRPANESVKQMRAISLGIVLLLASCGPTQAAEHRVSFEQRAGSLGIRIDAVEVAVYVFQDAQVPRPYFAHVKTRDGIQVTRRHPPQKDIDAVDHAGLHTGIWLSFGDLSGQDYWRLKAKTEHVRFKAEPQGGSDRGTFAVVNRYLTSDGKSDVCEEICRYTINVIADGYLIDMASEFRPDQTDLVFGDQEEMGLGIRVATPLAVDRKLGGQIRDSAGRKNGSEVWGKTAEWCDYSGTLDGKWVGLTLLTGPENFRPCWCHARDYGFLAMNPFGRNAFTKQEPSRIVVKPGETFRLRYGVTVHSTAKETDYNPADVYRKFAQEKAVQ